MKQAAHCCKQMSTPAKQAARSRWTWPPKTRARSAATLPQTLLACASCGMGRCAAAWWVLRCAFILLRLYDTAAQHDAVVLQKEFVRGCGAVTAMSL